MTILWLCPTGRLDPLLTGTLTTLAVSDMWTGSLIHSGALAIVHFVGLGMFRQHPFCLI